MVIKGPLHNLQLTEKFFGILYFSIGLWFNKIFFSRIPGDCLYIAIWKSFIILLKLRKILEIDEKVSLRKSVKNLCRNQSNS